MSLLGRVHDSRTRGPPQQQGLEGSQGPVHFSKESKGGTRQGGRWTVSTARSGRNLGAMVENLDVVRRGIAIRVMLLLLDTLLAGDPAEYTRRYPLLRNE